MRCSPAPRATATLSCVFTALLATGCASAPDHTAGVWLWPGESLTLRATGPAQGPPPKIRISNHGPGPLGAVAWVRPEGTTTFGGLPVGGDLELTITGDDTLRLADGGGSRLQIDMWSTKDYALENAPPVGPLRGLTNDQLREKLASR